MFFCPHPFFSWFSTISRRFIRSCCPCPPTFSKLLRPPHIFPVRPRYRPFTSLSRMCFLIPSSSRHLKLHPTLLSVSGTLRPFFVNVLGIMSCLSFLMSSLLKSHPEVLPAPPLDELLALSRPFLCLYMCPRGGLNQKNPFGGPGQFASFLALPLISNALFPPFPEVTSHFSSREFSFSNFWSFCALPVMTSSPSSYLVLSFFRPSRRKYFNKVPFSPN